MTFSICKFSRYVKIGIAILLLQLIILRIHWSKQIEESNNYLRQIFSNGTETENQILWNFYASASEGSWQSVGSNSAQKLWVFSAFLDIRAKNVVKLIAVTHTNMARRSKSHLWCKLWYKLNDNITVMETVTAKLSIIQEHWNLPFSAYYVDCPLKGKNSCPEVVSLVTDLKHPLENLLKVIVNYDVKNDWNPRINSPFVDKMALCVKPLHYEYNKVLDLLEFIELYRILGVDHFVFYNHSVGPEVDCLLEKFRKENIITILPWKLPLQSQKDIRTEGIFASLNDCLFRTMHKYSHTIFVDLDEFIIPTNHYSFKEFFRFLYENHNIRKKSSFNFRNSFFYLQWPDDPDSKLFKDPIAQDLLVLRKTRRNVQFHPHNVRSKMIVRPDLISMVGNHFIWKYFNQLDFGNYMVDPNDAFMAHYRLCEFGGDDCVHGPSIIDKTMYRYKDELIGTVQYRHTQYLSDCQKNLINIRNATLL